MAEQRVFFSGVSPFGVKRAGVDTGLRFNRFP